MRSKRCSFVRACRTLAQGDHLPIGGDFMKWSHEVDSILRLQDLHEYTSAAARKPTIRSNFLRHQRKARISKARKLLCAAIGPLSWTRTPQDLIQDPSAIWAFLSRLSKPFRIMDLPPELRNKIYATHVNDQHAKFIVRDGLVRRSRIPALLQSSRQVRDEAISIFYSDCTFHIWCTRNGLPNAKWSEPGVWYEAMVWIHEGMHNKFFVHLRKVVVDVRSCCRFRTLRLVLEVTNARGVSLRAPRALGPIYGQKIQDFINFLHRRWRVEKLLSGEVIRMAFTGVRPVWKPWDRHEDECVWV